MFEYVLLLKSIFNKKGAKKTMVARDLQKLVQLTGRQISAIIVQPWFFSYFLIKNGLYVK